MALLHQQFSHLFSCDLTRVFICKDAALMFLT
jgi:hypothetical protein